MVSLGQVNEEDLRVAVFQEEVSMQEGLTGSQF